MYKVVIVEGMVNNGVQNESVKELQKLLNTGWLIHHSIAMRDSCIIVLKQGKEA